MKILKKIIFRIIFFPENFFGKINLRIRSVKFGDNLELLGWMYIKGFGKITIGKNVRIISSQWLNPIGGDSKTCLQVLKSGKLTIGSYCGLSNVYITCSNSVTIGERVFLGAGVKIYDTDFHPVHYSYRSIYGDDIYHVKSAPIVIENDVFIGAHSIILKGSHIGCGSVIGAGSVVCGVIPSHQIWAGNPAVFIKQIAKNE